MIEPKQLEEIRTKIENILRGEDLRTTERWIYISNILANRVAEKLQKAPDRSCR